MKVFLIILLCQGFSLGPATMFQTSDYLAKCNAFVWDDECKCAAKPLSNITTQGGPWGECNYAKSARGEAGHLGSETKSGSANLAIYKCDGDPWEQSSHKPLTKHRR